MLILFKRILHMGGEGVELQERVCSKYRNNIPVMCNEIIGLILIFTQEYIICLDPEGLLVISF